LGARTLRSIGHGVNIPMVGLGTWQYNDSVAEAATKLALDLGYTHIDTALGYKNQLAIAKVGGLGCSTKWWR
jgi:diketogulonate reductase-like aldo/keto reductase